MRWVPKAGQNKFFFFFLRLIQADTSGTHLAHEVCNVDAGGASVRGAEPDASVVCDHLGEDIQDGLYKQHVSKNRIIYSTVTAVVERSRKKEKKKKKKK